MASEEVPGESSPLYRHKHRSAAPQDSRKHSSPLRKSCFRDFLNAVATEISCKTAFGALLVCHSALHFEVNWYIFPVLQARCFARPVLASSPGMKGESPHSGRPLHRSTKIRCGLDGDREGGYSVSISFRAPCSTHCTACRSSSSTVSCPSFSFARRRYVSIVFRFRSSWSAI